MEEPEIDVVTAQQLKKTLDALNDTVKAINKHIEGVSEGISETKKGSKKIENIWTENLTLSEKLNKSAVELRDIFTKTAEVLFSFESIFSFTDMAKNLIRSNSELYRLGINSGKGAEEGKKLQKTVIGLETHFGATREAAEGIVKTLSEGNFAGNMEKAAAASYQFARATGSGEIEIANLTLELSKSVGMSEEAIASSYASILKVQQNYGITKKGITELNNSIAKSAYNMKAFGKSSEAIKSMIGNTAKLVSSMEKVGISASTALGYIERLTDPERIEENLGLYSQLGVSMEDALIGGNISGQVENGLKEFGEKVKAMGPIAGAQYAKSFGMTYKDAVKAAGLEKITEDVTTPEEQSLEAMNKLADATKDIGEKIKDIGNKTKGFFEKMGPALLSALSIISPTLMSIIKASVKKGIEKGAEEGNESIRGKNLQEGGKDSESSLKISKGFGNGAKKIETVFKSAISGISKVVDKAKNIHENIKKIGKIGIGKSIKNAFVSSSKTIGETFSKAGRKLGDSLNRSWEKLKKTLANTKVKFEGGKTGGKASRMGGLPIGGGWMAVIGIALALIAPLLNKLKETLTEKIEPAMKSFDPAMKVLSNIMANVAKSLTPIFEKVSKSFSKLFENLGPILLTIADTFGEMSMIVFEAIEPVLFVLVDLLQVIAPVLKMQLFLYKYVIAPILKFTLGIIQKLTSLLAGIFKHKNKEVEALEENTDATNKNTDGNEKAKIINSGGNAVSTKESINSTNSTQQASDTSNNVSNNVKTSTSITEGQTVKKISTEFSDYSREMKRFTDLLYAEIKRIRQAITTGSSDNVGMSDVKLFGKGNKN